MTTEPGYFIGGRKKPYSNVEAAITAAKSAAKRDGFSKRVFFRGDEVATASPDGHVDLTWEGSKIASCKAPERKRKVSKERLLF